MKLLDQIKTCIANSLTIGWIKKRRKITENKIGKETMYDKWCEMTIKANGFSFNTYNKTQT